MPKPLSLAGLTATLALVLSPAVHGLTDDQIVQSLEALGEYAAAWPLALAEAERRNDYQG